VLVDPCCRINLEGLVAYTYARTHARAYTYTHAHAHTHTHAHTYTLTRIHIHTRAYTYTHECVHTQPHAGFPEVRYHDMAEGLARAGYRVVGVCVWVSTHRKRQERGCVCRNVYAGMCMGVKKQACVWVSTHRKR
jgi:hypothetical protein